MAYTYDASKGNFTRQEDAECMKQLELLWFVAHEEAGLLTRSPEDQSKELSSMLSSELALERCAAHLQDRFAATAEYNSEINPAH